MDQGPSDGAAERDLLTMDKYGITEEGLKTALRIKESYKTNQPLCMPGERSRILVPENLLNGDLNLQGFEDPLPLAMMAARDPESPMALAAAARLGPLGHRTKLVTAVYGVVGEATKHPLVRKCVELVSDSDFNPAAIAHVQRQASRFVVKTRRQYTLALRQNLQALLEGSIAPRHFVKEFFELTEAGNLRSDIRKKLVLSLLMAENIRPSIKFLLLENFQRLPNATRLDIIGAILSAEPSHHIELLKEELRWIVSQDFSWSPA